MSWLRGSLSSYRARPSSRSRNFRTRIIKRGQDREKGSSSIHDIHERIDQSDFTARFPGSADSAFSSEWRCVHANSLCFVSGGKEQDDGFLG